MSVASTCPGCGGPADGPGFCEACRLKETVVGAAAVAGKAPGPPAASGPSPTSRVDLATCVAAVRELDVVTPADLEQMAADAVGDAERLARRLVRAGRLTPYQASAVVSGKGKGLLIGSYLVLEKLAQGGMGVVFRARHRSSREIVALKMLPPSFGRDADSLRRFQREFAIASRLSHPNVVRGIEAGEDRGVHFLAMEYIDGHDLDRLVASGGPLDVRLALHCVVQAARGLEAAHAQGVIHRDVKPGNIMIDTSGEVRLLDLGLARVLEAANTFGRDAAHTLTRTGAYMGTVDYLAPEQADDAKAADHRADIYALGCTLYYLLTGRPPFPGDTLLKRLMAHQDRPAPSLRAARPEVPPALEALYQRMMAKRPAERPNSMSDVVLGLEACRANAREAGDASADLKSFARTVFKRGEKRGPDTSVFARKSGTNEGPSFDPDLRLEDLVGDYRDEVPRQELREEQLPPRLASLPTTGVRRKRLRQGERRAIGAGAVVLLGLVGYLSWPRADRGESETRPLAAVEASRSSGMVSLFNGEDLNGWEPLNPGSTKPGDWTASDGLIVGHGRGVPDMHLLTTRDFEEFELEFDYRVAPETNSGLMFVDRDRKGGKAHLIEFNLSGSKLPNWRTGDLFLSLQDAKGASVVRTRTVGNSDQADGAWSHIEVRSHQGELTFDVNGHRMIYPEPVYLDQPRRLGIQAFRDQIEVKNIQVRELPPSPTGNRPPRVLLVEDFADPRSGFPRLARSAFEKDKSHDYGYDNGVWYASMGPSAGWYSWRAPIDPLPDFDGEFLIKVITGTSKAHGSAVMHLFTRGPDSEHSPGFQVRIDDRARLFVEVSTWKEKTYPKGPWRGPITHPAIRPGGQPNLVTLKVRGQRLEILVNHEAVTEPFEFEYGLPLVQIQLGVASEGGDVRAEWDRIELKATRPGVPEGNSVY